MMAGQARGSEGDRSQWKGDTGRCEKLRVSVMEPRAA